MDAEVMSVTETILEHHTNESSSSSSLKPNTTTTNPNRPKSPEVASLLNKFENLQSTTSTGSRPNIKSGGIIILI
ncbi:unnamed protein product [Cunninghamella echinulata]